MVNFAGMNEGKFFGGVPDYIDKSVPAGFSKLPRATVKTWLTPIFRLEHIWGSPNLVWLIITILVYYIFPYDLSKSSLGAKSPLSVAFFLSRFPLWFSLVFGYTLYWHVCLYALNFAKRSFLPNRVYNKNKVIHNVFWSSIGIIVFVLIENVMVYLWCHSRIPYLSDKEAFSTSKGFAILFLGAILTPVWRDVHFYFAHRFIHVKPMFTFVHSLHHRNTDIEPFAGLSMHPVEHLYYYSSILPSVVFYCSPFHFLWNGVHLLLAPGASHSGWEDHFQADGFHYMHHRYFEYNYAGYSASFLDVYFNTFQQSFQEKSHNIQERADSKAVLGAPTLPFVIYLLASFVTEYVWAAAAVNVAQSNAHYSEMSKLLLSFSCGFGPIVVAYIMSYIRQRDVAALFQASVKRSSFDALIHFTMGAVTSAAPIAYMAYLTLQ